MIRAMKLEGPPAWTQAGDQREKKGAGRWIGVLVECDVHAPVAALVNESDHSLAHAVQGAVEVGNLHRDPSLGADVYRLTERVQETVAAVVTAVGDVRAAVGPETLADFRQFMRVAIGAGDVGQAGGETECTVPHPFFDKGLHVGEFVVIREALLPAHSLYPDRGVGHEVDDVAGGFLVEKVQELLDRPPTDVGRGLAVDCGQVPKELLKFFGRRRGVGQAVLAQGVRRDSLRELGLVPGVVQESEVRVGVHVDESRTDNTTRGVDGARCLNSRGLPPDDGHRVPGHTHVGAEPGLSRAVNDSAA